MASSPAARPSDTPGGASRAAPAPAPSMPRRKSSSQALHVGSLNTASFSAGLNTFGGASAGSAAMAFPSSRVPERGNGLGLGVGLGGAVGTGSTPASSSSGGGGGSALSSSVGRGVGEGAGARIKRQVLGTEREVLVQRNGFGSSGAATRAGAASSSPAAPPPPKLFDFRMTDRPGAVGATATGHAVATAASSSSSTSPPTSLLSRQIRTDTLGAGGGNGTASNAPPVLRTASTSNAVPTLSSASTSTGTPASTPVPAPAPAPSSIPSSTRLGAIQHATAVSASRAALMRPRAMSMTMKIKGELRENGDEVDPDDAFAGLGGGGGGDGDGDGDGGEGEGDEGDVDMDGRKGRIVRDVGKGSGGIKGKRKGMVFRCESCSKVRPACSRVGACKNSPRIVLPAPLPGLPPPVVPLQAPVGALATLGAVEQVRAVQAPAGAAARGRSEASVGARVQDEPDARRVV